MQVKGEHTHAPDAAEVDAKRAMAMLFEQASSTVESTQLVLANTLSGLHSSAITHLPTTANMKRTIQHVRTVSAGSLLI